MNAENPYSKENIEKALSEIKEDMSTWPQWKIDSLKEIGHLRKDANLNISPNNPLA